jgi:hypothetical protein
LLSSGEVTPFELEMTRANIAGRFELSVALDGKIDVAQRDFQ